MSRQRQAIYTVTLLHNRETSSYQTIIELQTQASQATCPAGLQYTHSEKKSKCDNVPRLNENQSHGMPMTNTVTARTAGPAIKRMLLKRFTTFPPLIRQYRRTRGHIPSITLHTSRRRSTHSRSFPSISHCLILLRFPYPCPYEFFYLAARLNREKVGHLDLRQTFQVTVHNIPADK